MMPKIRNAWRMFAGVALLAMAAPAWAAEPSAALKKGTPDLKSAGPLAFGPDGILFVGDTQARPCSPSTRATALRRPGPDLSRSLIWVERSRDCSAPIPSRS